MQRGSETASGEPDESELREVLIRIEIFAGRESPQEDRERRRALQVERLSARMRGGAAMTPHQELAELTASGKVQKTKLREHALRELGLDQGAKR